MLSPREFLDALRQCNWLDPAKIDELTRQHQGRTFSRRALAKQLVERGLLTSYQVEELLAGRGPNLVFGPYVILSRLGQGGMGEVYKARHRRLGRIDALKVVRKEGVEHTDAAKRFDREVRAAAQLRHPNVVLVYDADEIDGVHYMSMEYVESTDLSRLVKEHGPLPVASACEYIRQAAVGLQHIHEHSLVHRDLKPSNLLLQQAAPGQSEVDRVVKILDLGLVRFQPSIDSDRPGTMTVSGTVVGTPDFLAPEQAMDAHKVDIRADLYSLGCTLYYLLTAKVPFPGDNFTQKLVAHQMEEPTPVERHRPDVPASVVAVVRKLMSKKPEGRYQTPAELAEELARIGKHLSGEQPASAPDACTQTVSADATPPPVAPRRRRKQQRANQWLLLGAALILLAPLLLLVWPWLWDSSPPDPEEPPPSSAAPLVSAPVATKPISPPTSPPATRLVLIPAKPFTNSIGMELVWIEPGSFQMGSPEGEHKRETSEVQHPVTLTEGFWMQTTLVTQRQWKAVMGESNNPSRFQDDDLPVDSVSWHDARAFCKKLQQNEKGGWEYRLPYEAEWEFAARAGARAPFWQGQTIGTQDANFDGNYPYRDADARGEYREKTTPVKKFRPNPLGLHDMGGNLWQWCEDWYGLYPPEAIKNPKGTSNGDDRVVRGGSWRDPARACRAARRHSFGPDNHRDDFGFRVVLTAGKVR
jgi:formylglycine-generating enzyme required for sulfatase activity/tRNA A-37 threonylcarbamoyl transferase component Bud32